MKAIKFLMSTVLVFFLMSCETTSDTTGGTTRVTTHVTNPHKIPGKSPFELLSGFDYRDKDMIRLKLDEIKFTGVKLDNYDMQKMTEYLKNKLIEVKRFTILTGKGDFRDMAEVDVNVKPQVDFLVRTANGEHHHGAKVLLMVRFGRLQTGVEEDALTVKGTSGRNSVRSKGDAIKDEIAEKFGIIDVNKAFDEACERLIKEISKKYPLASKVTAIRNLGDDNITMSVDRGSLWGYSNEDIFQIYTMKDNLVNVVAIASGMVARESSTLKIIHWNMEDEYVRDVLKPSILKNGLKEHDLRAVQMIR